MKPDRPPLQSKRPLDQLRERVRYMHYSPSAENGYLCWVRIFIRWHGLRQPAQTQRIPAVLTKDEVAGALAYLDGVPALMARLPYDMGMRLMEGMRLRVKDVDFDRRAVAA